MVVAHPDDETIGAGAVLPQPRLMLKPSGATPTGTTSAPSSHSTVGATR